MSPRAVLVLSATTLIIDAVVAPAADTVADAGLIRAAEREVERSSAMLDDLASASTDSLRTLLGQHRLDRWLVRVSQQNDSTFDIVVATPRDNRAIAAATVHPDRR